MLGNLGKALFEAGTTIAWLKGGVDAASAAFGSVATAAENASPGKIPAMTAVGGLWVVPAQFTPTDFDPLHDLFASLDAARISVSDATGGRRSLFANQTPVTVDDLSSALMETGKDLAKAAKRLDQTLALPTELLT